MEYHQICKEGMPVPIPSSSPSREELDELIGFHVEKSIQIHASETKLLERSPLRLPWGYIRIHIRLQSTTKITRLYMYACKTRIYQFR